MTSQHVERPRRAVLQRSEESAIAPLEPDGLLRYVDDFLGIYPTRPIARNEGGMGLNHSFGLYATLRALNPTLVVESGVCLDPSPEYRTHTAPDAYDFSDEFAGVDWTQFDRVYRRGGVSRRPTSCCFRRAV